MNSSGVAHPAGQAPGSALVQAVQVMDRLRSAGGCPWDAEQTHDSLRRYLVEECDELLEAIEQKDDQAIREELGDVLLQALTMSQEEQTQRMRRMREIVRENNVYRWAGSMLLDAARLRKRDAVDRAVGAAPPVPANVISLLERKRVAAL